MLRAIRIKLVVIPHYSSPVPAMAQVDPQEALVAALRREVRLLRAENAFLRQQACPHRNPAQ